MDRNTTPPRPRKPTKLLVLAAVVTTSLTGAVWWYYAQTAAPGGNKQSTRAENSRVEKTAQSNVAKPETLENVPLAALPWSQDLEQPSLVALGGFKVPWTRSVAEPVLVKIDVAALPWQRQLHLGSLTQRPSPTVSPATGGSFIDQAQVPWVRTGPKAVPNVGVDTASVPWGATPAMPTGSRAASTPVTIDVADVPWSSVARTAQTRHGRLMPHMPHELYGCEYLQC